MYVIAAGIKQYELKIKKKKNKHDEFVPIDHVLKKYDKMKEEIKNSNDKYI